jgi:LPPG:FO 2-phospho-L-lactate transferase
MDDERARVGRGLGAPTAQASRIVVLSGGVGGARFLRGLVDVVDPATVTVVANVGDDLERFGLHVSPDLDSILYTLAGVADDERGWGRAEETWNALEEIGRLGGETWFQLGDRDIGLHLVRAEALARGEPLSAITARVAERFGLAVRLVPATDDRLRTQVDTPAGGFTFQEWFVGRRHSDPVDRVWFEGAETARPAPGVLDALDGAELLLIAPSNPFISIWPILAVEGIRGALERRRVPCVAVSPLIAGRAVKGPADRMLTRLAGGTEPVRVATCYQGLIDVLVLDESDASGAPEVERTGVRPVVTRTLMQDGAARRAVAEAVLACAR